MSTSISKAGGSGPASQTIDNIPQHGYIIYGQAHFCKEIIKEVRMYHVTITGYYGHTVDSQSVIDLITEDEAESRTMLKTIVSITKMSNHPSLCYHFSTWQLGMWSPHQ